MKRIKIVLTLLSVVFFLTASSNRVLAAEARGVSKDLIKIGLIADQTGPAAEVTIPYTVAFKNYFRNVNDTGGINGRRIKLIIEDDGYSIPRAVAAFKKLVFRDKVLAILGCGGTGQNTALLPQIKKNKVPVITISWSWTMTDPVKRYVFTPVNDNKDEIRIIMDYIVKTLKAKNPRIALISPDVEYGKSGVRVANAKAEEYNVEIVGREIIPVGGVDASSQMLSLRKKKATHIITLTTIGSTLAVLKDAKRYGYFPVYFNSFHIFSDEVAKMAGNTAKNVYGAGAIGSWFDDTKGIAEVKKISLKYNPDMKPPNRYYIKAWVSSEITYEGIKRAGKNLTPDTFANALETIKNMDMRGLTGTISFGPKDHKGNDFARLYKADIEKGYFVPVTGWVRSK